MTAVMRAIKLSQLENELLDVRLEIKRLEGVINSPNVKNVRRKNRAKDKLLNLIKKQDRISSEITEAIFLDADVT